MKVNRKGDYAYKLTEYEPETGHKESNTKSKREHRIGRDMQELAGK